MEKSVGLVLQFGSHTIPHSHPFSFSLTCMFCKLSPNISLFNICSILHSCYESFVCALLASENSQGVPRPPAYSLRLPEAETGVESARYVSPCRRQASTSSQISCVFFCWVSLFWAGLRSILSYIPNMRCSTPWLSNSSFPSITIISMFRNKPFSAQACSRTARPIPAGCCFSEDVDVV